MRAVTYQGKHDVEVRDVPEPRLEDETDAIIRITATAICGSDLHIYDRAIIGARHGDIMGHENVGIVEAVGAAVTHVVPGQRVLVPFVIACGQCEYCLSQRYSLCDRTNPNAGVVEPFYGHSPAGLFGYTHALGGYPGGQAQRLRVPHADVGLFAIPDEVSDSTAVLLTDVLPTAWMAVENCALEKGGSIAIAGAGPIGHLAAMCAGAMGAATIIVMDDDAERLERVAELPGVIPLQDTGHGVQRAIERSTGGHGPDAVLDAVGMEAHGGGTAGVYDRVKQRLRMQTDRPTALRTLIKAVRKGGRVSVPGVYVGVADKFPIGVIFGKGLTLVGGQTHVQRYVPTLLDLVADGTLDPARIITSHRSLEEAPQAYRDFHDKRELKVVLHP